METNYYQEILSSLENLIEKEEYIKAKEIITEELSMPYVPRDFQKQLLIKQEQIKGYLSKSKPQTILSQEQLYQYLCSNDEKAYKAIEILQLSNARNYLDTLSDFFSNEKINYYLKGLVLEILIDQQINHQFTLIKDSKEYLVNPINTAKPLQQKNVETILTNLYQLTSKNPSFYQQTQQILINVIYQYFPEPIADSDVTVLTYSIIYYVYKAYDDLSGFDSFIENQPFDRRNLIELHF